MRLMLGLLVSFLFFLPLLSAEESQQKNDGLRKAIETALADYGQPAGRQEFVEVSTDAFPGLEFEAVSVSDGLDVEKPDPRTLRFPADPLLRHIATELKRSAWDGEESGEIFSTDLTELED